MPKKKRTKKMNITQAGENLQDRKLIKQQDREWRRLKAKIHTQIDNAFVEFMYTLDTADTEISEAAENFILNLLYEPETVELIENKIKNGEKQMKSLISAMRKLAKYLLKMEEVKNQKWVEEKNLEFAIPKVNIWPINLLKL